ncbi:hypothetical protein [Bifidobacterium sp. B3998]|uniref:hypothetical protein n=1 Tax=Bifidobacterium sp. B3998 TaxID=2817963 RepID=UPI00226B1FC1|nr:hypothetical protein [Bifidobacterium sp. B3998]MCX8669226.1 hypothetical protein [Bifidobacterium sp. B3998]
MAFILPLLWLFFAAFDGEAIFQTKIPRHWNLKNFAAIMTKDQTSLPLWNGFLISAVVTVIILACALTPPPDTGPSSTSSSSTPSYSAPACRSPV